MCNAETKGERIARIGDSEADTVETPKVIRERPVFKDILEFKEALDNGTVSYDDVTPIVCKFEMFFNGKGGHTYFESYYGTMNACRDIVVLLGFDEEFIEHV